MDDIFNFGYNIHVKVSKPLLPPKDSLYASTAPILTSSSGFTNAMNIGGVYIGGNRVIIS